MNVLNMKTHKTLKQLKKVEGDLVQILHFLNKAIPFCEKHKHYIGMRDILGKLDETQVVLQVYHKRVGEALRASNNRTS